MGDGAAIARVKMKVVITNDAWEDDPAYAQTADGRPRIPPAGEGKNVPPALSGSLAYISISIGLLEANFFATFIGTSGFTVSSW